jgi:hypothetical protein
LKKDKCNDKKKRIIESNVQVRGKARLPNAINVVLKTTLQRNAELPYTWLNCTKKIVTEANNAKRSYEAHLNNETK